VIWEYYDSYKNGCINCGARAWVYQPRSIHINGKVKSRFWDIYQVRIIESLSGKMRTANRLNPIFHVQMLSKAFDKAIWASILENKQWEEHYWLACWLCQYYGWLDARLSLAKSTVSDEGRGRVCYHRSDHPGDRCCCQVDLWFGEADCLQGDCGTGRAKPIWSTLSSTAFPLESSRGFRCWRSSRTVPTKNSILFYLQGLM